MIGEPEEKSKSGNTQKTNTLVESIWKAAEISSRFLTFPDLSILP